jgi:hypothetical protein
MSSMGYPYQQTNFTGDRRHINPILSAYLYVPPPPESITTPPRKQKSENASIKSQSSFASTVSLIKRRLSRGKKH